MQDGRSAIVTAGPPAAGKSTALHAEIVGLDTYRILDADIVKEYLIEQALDDGIYDDLLLESSPTDTESRQASSRPSYTTNRCNSSSESARSVSSKGRTSS